MGRAVIVIVIVVVVRPLALICLFPQQGREGGFVCGFLFFAPEQVGRAGREPVVGNALFQTPWGPRAIIVVVVVVRPLALICLFPQQGREGGFVCGSPFLRPCAGWEGGERASSRKCLIADPL